MSWQFLLVALLASCCARDEPAAAPSAGSVSLLVAEVVPGSSIADVQILVRYRFQDGILIARDEILKAPSSDIRYGLGRNQIYRDRYVITSFGSIVDIIEKELIFSGEGEVIAIDGDRVILHRSHVGYTGFSYFDLAKREHRRQPPDCRWSITQPQSMGTARLSPDRTMSASSDSGEGLSVHSLDGKTRKLAANLDYEISPIASPSFSGLPMLWLDNRTILTQQTNGKLVTLDLEGKLSPLVTITCDVLPLLPSFYRDAEDRIIYDCVDSYVIDVENRSYSPLVATKLGNGFELQDGMFSHRGKEIGKGAVRTWSANTMPEHLAVLYKSQDSGSGEPEGVKVWSSLSGKWTGIELGWFGEIIGWIDDSP